MLGKRGRLVRSRWLSVRGDTISSSKGLLSRQCLASDSMRRPARSKSPRRLILRRARGRMAWRTSENIVLIGSENTCGAKRVPHQSLEGAAPVTYQRQNVPQPYIQKRDRTKKAGHWARLSQTGRLHVGETWDHEDPEFQRDQPKPFVSKT